MSIYKILNPLLALWVAASLAGCESDATGIVVNDGQHVGILSCVAEDGENLVVNVYGSASYSDTARYTVIDNVAVSLVVDGAVRQFAYMGEGETSVSLGMAGVGEGEVMTIEAKSPSMSTLTGSTEIMCRRRVERLDTLTISGGATLRLTAYIRDSAATDDYYQLRTLMRSWRDGEMTESALKCEYISTAFTVASSVVTNESSGLFDDTRLATLSNGLSPLTVTTSWTDIRTEQDASDSAFVVVRMSHMSADYYTFLQTSAQAQEYIFLPIFSMTSVHTNVSGGLGIVGSVARDEVAIRLETTEQEEDASAEVETSEDESVEEDSSENSSGEDEQGGF